MVTWHCGVPGVAEMEGKKKIRVGFRQATGKRTDSLLCESGSFFLTVRQFGFVVAALLQKYILASTWDIII